MFGYGILGIADATGTVNLFQLEEDENKYALNPWRSWRMNSEKALCLSLDWTNPAGNTSTPLDARLIVSQSNGTLAMVPTLNHDILDEEIIDTWSAHDYEAWIAAWDCWSNGNVVWSGA